MDIIVNNLSKAYGTTLALDNATLTIPDKKKTAVIGHNGSGKTTLLEILCGLRRFDQGTINLEFDDEYKEKLGVILQDNAFYHDAKAIELIELFSTFYKTHADLDYIIKLTGIESFMNRFYRNLSGGMKQKVNIALALVNNPRILILDEPTTGLDPLARKELWQIITAFSQNTLTLISSHYMDEIERNCDYLIFLKDGKLIECDYVSAVLDRAKMSLEDYYISVNEKGN